MYTNGGGCPKCMCVEMTLPSGYPCTIADGPVDSFNH